MNDDFDFRTPEERAADDADELQQLEIVQLARQLDDEQAALARLADADPMGFVFSGQPHEGRTAAQADAWLAERLHPKGDTPAPGNLSA